MYQAILVKYLGPTDYRGSRWKATAAAGSITLGYDHALNTTDNAATAARALCDKFQWDGAALQGGQLASGDYVFTVSYPVTEGS